MINYGRYPQGENGEVKPIEWQILKQEGNAVLLISRYALDCIPYNEKWEDTTWEACNLRRWLHEEFLQKAFNEEEQSRIVPGQVTTEDNPRWGTHGGMPTTDKIFLLSMDEAEEYFADDEARKVYATEYAVNQGVCIAEKDGGTSLWWLRSPGFEQNYAAEVMGDGMISVVGEGVDQADNAIRPALWIYKKMKSGKPMDSSVG